MICPRCQQESHHLRIDSRGIGCHKCFAFSETGGSSTDKILTRASYRVTEQQLQYEGDTITPYIVDKSTKQAVVNEDFITLYPEQSAQTYSQAELQSVGQAELKPSVDTDDKADIVFSGDEATAMGDVLKNA